MIGKISYHTTTVSMSRKKGKCFYTAVSIFSHVYFPHKAARNWNINKCQQKSSAVPRQRWSTSNRISSSENQQTQFPIYRYRYNKNRTDHLRVKNHTQKDVSTRDGVTESVSSHSERPRSVARTLNDCVSPLIKIPCTPASMIM